MICGRGADELHEVPLFVIILPCPAERVSVPSVVDGRLLVTRDFRPPRQPSFAPKTFSSVHPTFSFALPTFRFAPTDFSRSPCRLPEAGPARRPCAGSPEAGGGSYRCPAGIGRGVLILTTGPFLPTKRTICVANSVMILLYYWREPLRETSSRGNGHAWRLHL